MIRYLYVLYLFPGFAKIGISRTPKGRHKSIADSVEGKPVPILVLPFFGAASIEWLLLRITLFMKDSPKVIGRYSGKTEFRRLRVFNIPIPFVAPVVCTLLALIAFIAQLSFFVMALIGVWSAVST